ncbi:MAG TPA: NADH-quinone oxidoreductase subunit M [Chloroflexia bacterium]|nr:NADH-quinone oxidoreductase subunit M [Chloroflexia bacterium]
MLSAMTYIPLIGAVIIAVLPTRNPNAFRWVALLTTAINFGLSVYTTLMFNRGAPGYQFEEKSSWIGSIGANYHMGVDGVSILMVLLDGLLFLVAILASWKAIQRRVREYYVAMLLLNVGLVGVFCALDFFLFYIFWELVLIPMAILIGVWGGANRIYAAYKFFIYTLAGSLLMLVAIIALYFEAQPAVGHFTLDIVEITAATAKNPLNYTFQVLAFLAFGVAFAIKVPMWPLHTWLPDAHTEAPTAGSVILAGVMLKMGCYGFIRFNLPLFPDASKDLAPVMIVLALIAILYGALVALVQPDMKKLVAYSSVSHMGFVILGLFSFAYGLGGRSGQTTDPMLLTNSQAFEGAVFVMFAHGLLTGGLFLGVGVIYERLHTRDIKTIQNTLRVANRMPLYATVFMLYAMGSLGLPGIAGFIGEFLVMQGAFRVNGWFAFVACIVVILAALYLLWMYQRVFFGKTGDYDPAVTMAHGGHGHDTHAPDDAGTNQSGPAAGADNSEHGTHGLAPSPRETVNAAAMGSAQPGIDTRRVGTDSLPEHGSTENVEHGHGHHVDPDVLANGAKFPDLDLPEGLALIPMGILAVVVGVVPALVLDFLTTSGSNLTITMVEHSNVLAALSQILNK